MEGMMSRPSIDEIAKLFYDLQESIWENWEQTPEYLRETGYIRQPDERLTLEQITAQIANIASTQRNFSMDKVTTGARRKWRNS
jgi:hypothetical protein